MYYCANSDMFPILGPQSPYLWKETIDAEMTIFEELEILIILS